MATPKKRTLDSPDQSSSSPTKKERQEEEMEEEQASNASEAEEAATSESEEEGPPRKVPRTAERSAHPFLPASFSMPVETMTETSHMPVPQQQASERSAPPPSTPTSFYRTAAAASTTAVPQQQASSHMPVEMIMETSQQEQQQQRSPGMGLRSHSNDDTAAAAGLDVMGVAVADPAVRAERETTSRPRIRVEQPHQQQQQQIYHDDNAAVEAQEEASSVQLERQVEQVGAGSRGKKWVLPIFGLLMVVAVSALLTLVANSSSSGGLSSSSSSSDAAKDLADVCYDDYPPVDEDYDNSRVLCRGSEWRPCPPGAVCSGGLLRECADHMMAATPAESTAQKTCVLSTVDTMLRQLLHEWTVAVVCNGKNPHTAARYKGTDQPLFLYSQLPGELVMGYKGKLMPSDNYDVFVWEDLPDGNRAIGLHPSHLELPGTCSAKLFLFEYFCSRPLHLLLSILRKIAKYWW